MLWAANCRVTGGPADTCANSSKKESNGKRRPRAVTITDSYLLDPQTAPTDPVPDPVPRAGPVRQEPAVPPVIMLRNEHSAGVLLAAPCSISGCQLLIWLCRVPRSAFT